MAVYVPPQLIQLTNGGLSFSDYGKLDNTTALRPSTLEENLGKLNLARCLEQFDKILVRGGPRQLYARL